MNENTKMVRPNVIPFVTRKVAGKAERTVCTIFGEEKHKKVKKCNTCSETLLINNFYVKQNRQHVPLEYLDVEDFRTMCIKCHDAKRREDRKHRKYLLDKERDKVRRELSFLTDDEFNRMLDILKEERAFRNLPPADLTNILFEK
jgi:hypothetical protein